MWRSIREEPWHSIDESLTLPRPDPRPLPEFPRRSILDHLFSPTVSIGAHMVLALVLTFLVVLSSPIEDDTPVVVNAPRPVEKAPDFAPVVDAEFQKMEKVEVKELAAMEDWEREETDDEEMFEQAKGDGPEFMADRPFRSNRMFDVVGTVRTGGGRFGFRVGGKERLLRAGGGGRDTEESVLAALLWLARHQSEDGSWSMTGFAKNCREEGACAAANHIAQRGNWDVAITALPILAFLGAGYSHLSRDTHEGINFGEVVRKGLEWLINQQQENGLLGPVNHHYHHHIAALALSEAFGLTGDSRFGRPAQKAIDYTADAQSRIGEYRNGWRYSFQSRQPDTTVTGWAVMALKSAELSGLTFPKSCYDGAIRWLDSVTDKEYYRVGYTRVGDRVRQLPTLTAVGIMSRIFIKRDKTEPKVAVAGDLLVAQPPAWGQANFYYWYYATLALFQLDGPDGPKWRKWNGKIKSTLLDNQNRKTAECRYGSWEPVSSYSRYAGRVYATALNCMSMEVYYRYANVFGGGKK